MFAVVLAIGFVIAALSIFSVNRDVNVDASVIFTGDNAEEISIAGGECVYSDNLNAESQTSVIAPLMIETTVITEDCEITNTNNYLLNNLGGTCMPYPSETCEKRIFIQAKDVGISSLSDLDSISWDAIVSNGYAPHVDVLIDIDSDGDIDDALVFEYAKVDPFDCDDSEDYPFGEINTFDDKGIVDDDAYAWLSSGPAGPCGGETFDENHKSLADWKLEDYDVIGFELEIDNWIWESNSLIRNIQINEEEVEVSLRPLDELDYNVETCFELLCEGTYNIQTDSIPDESRR